MANGGEVSAGQVKDMDVISDARSVHSFVVGTKSSWEGVCQEQKELRRE